MLKKKKKIKLYFKDGFFSLEVNISKDIDTSKEMYSNIYFIIVCY